jgi:xylulokinase
MKNRPVFLCVDIGTSSMKGAVFSPEGECLSIVRIDLLERRPDPFSSWDAEIWSGAFLRLMAKLKVRRFEGIAVSGNGPTLVPLGDGDRPAHDVLLWIDKRVRPLAGQKSLFLPKAAWLMREKPDVYEKTRIFLPCPEYLVFRLTGEKRAFSASEDFSEYLWTGKALEDYGLAPEKFPPVIFTAAEAGRVTAAAAETFGILRGTPVYAGGPDFLMALLGTAAVRPGLSCDRAGTSEGVNTCVDRFINSEKLRCLPHIIPGCWNAAAILSSTGRLFEWFRGLSGQEAVPYDEMFRGIQSVSPAGSSPASGIPWFFPFLRAGDSWEFSEGMFIGLGAGHGRNEIGLAVVEAIGFAVRQAVENLEEQGLSVGELRISGGQAKNAVWNQMKADIVGKTLLTPETEDAELLGNLCAALCGRGIYANLRDASEALVRFKAEYVPDPAKTAFYADRYARYARAYSRFLAALKDSAFCGDKGAP